MKLYLSQVSLFQFIFKLWRFKCGGVMKDFLKEIKKNYKKMKKKRKKLNQKIELSEWIQEKQKSRILLNK